MPDSLVKLIGIKNPQQKVLSFIFFSKFGESNSAKRNLYMLCGCVVFPFYNRNIIRHFLKQLGIKFITVTARLPLPNYEAKKGTYFQHLVGLKA